MLYDTYNDTENLYLCVCSPMVSTLVFALECHVRWSTQATINQMVLFIVIIGDDLAVQVVAE